MDHNRGASIEEIWKQKSNSKLSFLSMISNKDRWSFLLFVHLLM